MPIQPLASLPFGCNVYLDATVFIYGGDGRSQECAALIERCSREEVTGVALFETINEATHRFMLIEAEERGFIQRRPAKALRAKPDVIPRLSEYWERTEHLLNMNLLFVAVDEALLRQAQMERASFGLLTNDSLIVACMRHLGIPFIASSDEDFGAVSGITLFRPDDVL